MYDGTVDGEFSSATTPIEPSAQGCVVRVVSWLLTDA